MLSNLKDIPTEKALLNIRLVELGADRYDLILPETHALPNIIGLDEEVRGIVYGRYKQVGDIKAGRGALVATNRRVLLIDKKPLFSKFDEIIYPVISGVTLTRAGAGMTVTLHTRMGDIGVFTLNKLCAKNFVKAIEDGIYVEYQNKAGDWI